MDAEAAGRAARRLRQAGARYAAVFSRGPGGLRLAASDGPLPATLRAATALRALPRARALRDGRRIVAYAVAAGIPARAAAQAWQEAAREAALAEPERDAALDAVAEVSQRLAGQVELGSILREVVERVRSLVPASCVYVALWDRGSGMIRFPYYHEGTRRDHAPDRPFSDGLTEYVLRTRRTLHIRRDFDAATRRRRIRWKGTPSRSWLGVPLILGEEAVGVLAVYDNDREEAFTDRHARIVAALAAQTAAALRNADLLEQAEARRERLRRHREALRHLTREALRAPDLAGALAEIARAAARTLGVQRVGIWMFEDGHRRIRCVELYDDGARSSGQVIEARDFPGYFRALESERSIEAHDAVTDPRTREFAGSYLLPLGITSLLDAPIRAGGRLVGIACHEHVGPRRDWRPEEEAFAASVADLAALALERAERERTEEALRTQTAFHTSLLQAQSDMGEGFLVLDPANVRILHVNDALLRISGRTREELTAGSFLDFVDPAHREEMAARVRARLAGEPAPEHYEMVGRRADGTALDLEVAVKKVQTPQGPRVIALVRDITTRKAAERELRRLTENLERLVAERTRDLEHANRNLQTVFDHTVNGFLFVDEEMRMVSANERFAEFFGLPLREVLHGDPETVRRKGRARYKEPRRFDEASRVYDADRRHLPSGSVVELADGRVLQEESVPIFDRGRYAGRVWTYHDITDRKRLEEELLRYAQTLEQEVEQRTNKLLQAAKMAALGQLVAGVAHEINNPLAFVKSNTTSVLEELHDLQAAAPLRQALSGEGTWEEAMAWLRTTPHWPFLTEDLERLLTANLRGLTRISDIVLRLRAVASPLPPRKEPTDLAAVLRDTAAIFLSQYGGRVRLRQTFEAVPKVVCDAGQIAQVAVNLLVNAGQAIPDRGEVELRLRREGPLAVFSVRDEGEGMPAEVRQRIFDPFFTTKDMGTGLGLSISYAIVKEHGGEILVQSEPGKGTTMTVLLPIGEVKA